MAGDERTVVRDHLVAFADLRVPSRGHFLILVAEQEVWQMNMLNAVTGKIEPVSFHGNIISRLYPPRNVDFKRSAVITATRGI